MSEAEHWEAQLRARLNDLLEKRLGPLTFEIGSLQATFNSVCARLIEQARAPLAGETAELEATIDGWFVEQQRRHADELAEARRAAQAALERERARRMDERAAFNAAIAEIERQRTQAGVLSALLDAAAWFAPRVVLFVVRGERAVAWRARGLMEEAIAALTLEIDSSALVGDAIVKQESIVASPGQSPGYAVFPADPAAARPARVLAVPLVIRGKAAAALYADADDEDQLDLQPLEALVRIAGLTIELLPLRRSTEPLTTEAALPRVFTSRPRLTVEIARESIPAPPSEPAPRDGKPAPEEARAEERSRREARSTSELPSPPAPPADESFEVPDTAPLGLPEAEDPPPPPPAPPVNLEEARAKRAVIADGETGKGGAGGEAEGVEAGVAEEGAEVKNGKERGAPPSSDRSQHANARRFARFLVAEIKLYYPAKVAEGLRRGDLYDRLREEIERNRYLYDRHVPAQISAEFDYFYDELVQMLAEGDAEKLGRNCPRPAIAVG